jgi:hypothetical protein
MVSNLVRVLALNPTEDCGFGQIPAFRAPYGPAWFGGAVRSSGLTADGGHRATRCLDGCSCTGTAASRRGSRARDCQPDGEDVCGRLSGKSPMNVWPVGGTVLRWNGNRGRPFSQQRMGTSGRAPTILKAASGLAATSIGLD